MEIERKYLIRELPENLKLTPTTISSRPYLCTAPVIPHPPPGRPLHSHLQVSGMMAHRGLQLLPLTRKPTSISRPKPTTVIITKRRYLIPLDDVTHDPSWISSPGPSPA